MRTKERNTKYVWMAVEANDYELPIAIANTADDLGKIVGINPHLLRQAFQKGSNGMHWGFRIYKVNIED